MLLQRLAAVFQNPDQIAALMHRSPHSTSEGCAPPAEAPVLGAPCSLPADGTVRRDGALSSAALRTDESRVPVRRGGLSSAVSVSSTPAAPRLVLETEMCTPNALRGYGAAAPGARAIPGDSGSVRGGTAQVNVLSEGVAPMVFFAYHQGGEAWRSMTKPRFSGKPQDYARFEKEWEEIERVYRATSPMGWNDELMFIEFEKCLDEATQLRLKARSLQAPRMLRSLKGSCGRSLASMRKGKTGATGKW